MELFVLLAVLALSQGRRLTAQENRERFLHCGSAPDDSPTPTTAQTDSSQFKILGGRNSGPRPYAAQLIYENGNDGDHCGGTMISSRHVLTAAHCVYEDREKFCNGTLYAPRNNATRWTVVLKSRCGHLNTDPSCDEKDAKIFAKPTKIFVNLNFFKRYCEKGGDIAIFELDRDYLPEEGVVPACLAAELDARKTQGGFHNYLQEVNLKLQGCTSGFAPDDALCTEEIDKNVCRGDSGGGLMIPAAVNNKPTVIGLVSHGARCINMWFSYYKHKYPGGVFTDVRGYNRFICRTTGVCPFAKLKKQKKFTIDEIPLFLADNPSK
uniref:Peptidase S1 domain-containing protein n=1 Tax=Steinernema glaseri TaxID=37863 RepID=A0A1I8AFN4_9BILA